METVIAIGVLAVLLTAFIAVFAPAAQGLRKAISVQEANRLAYTLERELVSLRGNDSDTYGTGFNKAYEWIVNSADTSRALLVYQYKGNPDQVRQDGTLAPFVGDGVAGQDFIVQPVVRTKDSPFLQEDMEALEGRIFTARLTQLVFDNGALIKGTPGQIVDPTPNDGDTAAGGGADGYPEATIAFAADFFLIPASDYNFIQNRLDGLNFTNPVFSRNLAVRR